MGVPEYRYKTTAFAISSFYAGIGGALFASLSVQLPPEQWGLIGAVNFIAALLIGGMGRVSGVLMGSFFVMTSHRFVEEIVDWMKHQVEEAGDILGSVRFFDQYGSWRRGRCLRNGNRSWATRCQLAPLMTSSLAS